MTNISVKNNGVKPYLFNYWKRYIFDAVKDFSHLFKLKTTINIVFEKSIKKHDNLGGYIAAEARHKRNNRYIITVYDEGLSGGLEDEEIDAVLFHEVCHIVDMINVSNNANYHFRPDKFSYTDKNYAIMNVGFSFWTEVFAYYVTNQILKFKNDSSYKKIVDEYERLLKEMETLPISYPKNKSSVKVMRRYMDAEDELLNSISMYMAYHLNSTYSQSQPLGKLCQELQPILKKMIKNPYDENMRDNLMKIGSIITNRYHNPFRIGFAKYQNGFELVYFFSKEAMEKEKKTFDND